jgi:hypothetical protein
MLRYFVGPDVSENYGIIYAAKRRYIPHDLNLLKRPCKILAVSSVCSEKSAKHVGVFCRHSGEILIVSGGGFSKD